MSQTSVEVVIGKSILDSEFRLLFFADPEKALAGFDLTPAEKTKLRCVDSETLDVLASILDERLGRFRLAGESCSRNEAGGEPLPALKEIQGE